MTTPKKDNRVVHNEEEEEEEEDEEEEEEEEEEVELVEFDVAADVLVDAVAAATPPFAGGDVVTFHTLSDRTNGAPCRARYQSRSTTAFVSPSPPHHT